MPWIELSLTLHSDQQETIEAALEDLGALSITLLDAEDHPIFEPGPGETPVWPTIKLAALFDVACDRVGLVHALTELVPEIAPDQLSFRDVADEDWVRAWMDTFQPMQFGRRLWIYPWNIEPPLDDPNAVIVRLDPGLAFGTGTHPTTALCLEWLDSLDLAGRTLVDYGCGSGVLAIAALKLGATHVIGVDNDPQALQASLDNAERNGVADRLELLLPDAYVAKPQDVLVANILAGPLAELAPVFAQSAKTLAPFAISGILAGQDAELLPRYATWFNDLQVSQREDWVRISGIRAERS
ncbi:MAG: 50S ribosomal protein L11 methyltransferase [Tahibacter sp.]